MAALASAAARYLLLHLAAPPPIPLFSVALASLWATALAQHRHATHAHIHVPHPCTHTAWGAPTVLHTAAFATAPRLPDAKGPPSARRGPPGKPSQAPAAPPPQRRPTNQQIKALEVRVVLPSGESRVMDTPAALRLAREHRMDLVEMSSSQVPAVCRIIDYRAHLEAAQAKADTAAREAAEREAAEARVPQKEVQFSVRIADHDLEIKMKKVLEFLHDGRKVLLVVKFRGAGERQAADQAMGYLLATVKQRAAITASAIAKGQHSLNCTVRLASGPQ